MTEIFQIIFFQPVLNLMIFLYDIIPGHDLGIVIILFTVIIKLILTPFSKKSIKSQKALNDLQPQIEEIKRKYANNKEEMGKAIMNLYKENKVNPFSSCLPLLIQLPFFFAIFKVFNNGFSEESFNLIYSFVEKPEIITHIAFGFLDLSKPNIFLAILAGGAQFLQAKMMITKKAEIKKEESKDENILAIMNKQMLYFMPIITVFIGATLPGGLILYWFVITVLTIIQQFFIFREKTAHSSN